MKPTKETLQRMLAELDGHAWRDAELEELVEPRLGIITGLAELLEDLERLRKSDLPGLDGA
ncbi:MAG: hypothetical protein AAF495_21105 [Pseudomonadota bacterium]